KSEFRSLRSSPLTGVTARRAHIMNLPLYKTAQKFDGSSGSQVYAAEARDGQDFSGGIRSGCAPGGVRGFSLCGADEQNRFDSHRTRLADLGPSASKFAY